VAGGNPADHLPVEKRLLGNPEDYFPVEKPFSGNPEDYFSVVKWFSGNSEDHFTSEMRPAEFPLQIPHTSNTQIQIPLCTVSFFISSDVIYPDRECSR
jgi:hypothetical protein